MVALVATMMVVIVGMVAFAVDIGWIVTSRTQLQSAADAAALAGASTLVEDMSLTATVAEAEHYGQINAPQAHISVTMGTWDPVSKVFTANNNQPHAVQVTAERTAALGNAAPAFFSRIFGKEQFDIRAESVAVGAVRVAQTLPYSLSVYVTSTKDLSNVVLKLDNGDGTFSHQKFEPLSGYSGTFSGKNEHHGKPVRGVWIKSGSYTSGDGPGYGEHIADDGKGVTIHGLIAARGSYAHVTATFEAKGIAFTDAGSDSPVRLVK
ncbi:MAG: pilus assembly protein TadG-related protein [Pirellulaceae bacterium]|jgi:Flp pilus assembly protein TadG|nr:pilus assembly protein TadG-related protein [Pirellulaceae bacterium]